MTNTGTRVLPSLQERITRILKEISGVVSQSGVTDWELQRLREWQEKKLAFGSDKQLKVIEQIEAKVFLGGTR